MTYRVVLADDHVMFRQGIKSILEASPAYTVVDEVGDGLSLLKLCNRTETDLVILDISMPHLGGIEATQEIKSRCPNIKVLMLTMHKDKEYIQSSFSAGCEGYLLKEDSGSELISAVETIRNGGIFLSPLLSRDVIDALLGATANGCKQPRRDPLTLREREVLKLIADGALNKEIADLLSISLRTVEHHRANIMEKLNIKQTARLIKYALYKGYTTFDL